MVGDEDKRLALGTLARPLTWNTKQGMEDRQQDEPASL